MKNVCLKPFNNKVFYKNQIFRINNGHNIFFSLDKKLKANGIFIKTIDACKEGDVFVYCDIPYPWSVCEWLRIIMHRGKNILYCFESPLVNPFNNIKLFKYLFYKVLTWNDEIVDNKKYYSFRIPQLAVKHKTRKYSFNEKKLICMVNAKKTSLLPFRIISMLKKDLYKKRLEIIKYFDKNCAKEFDLYGFGWDQPDRFKLGEKIFGFKKYQVYKGEVKDKLYIISKYKYCFAVENTEALGYITEKLFDCFQAGCVPIYLGAPNVYEYVPKGCFINLRDYENYDDLVRFLNNIDRKEYEEYIKKAKNFIKKKQTLEMWFEDGFEKNLLNSINTV